MAVTRKDVYCGHCGNPNVGEKDCVLSSCRSSGGALLGVVCVDKGAFKGHFSFATCEM